MSGSSSKEADAPYWAALAEGHLEMPQCASCGIWHWPAVWRCGECGTWNPTWRTVPAAGEVFSWTRTWHPFAGTEAIGTPFVTVIVSISAAGDRRLMGLLDPADSEIAIGDRVIGAIGSVTYGDRVVPTIKWRRAA